MTLIFSLNLEFDNWTFHFHMTRPCDNDIETYTSTKIQKMLLQISDANPIMSNIYTHTISKEL